MTDQHIIVVEKPIADLPEDADKALEGVATNVDVAPEPDSIRVSSVANMVDRIKGALGAGDRIEVLDIVGHGRPGAISVGAGLLTGRAGKEINGDPDEWLDELLELKEEELLCERATIRLLGCYTGCCDKGAEKLQFIADKLDVIAYGTNRALTPGDFGPSGFVDDGNTLVCRHPGQDDPVKCMVKCGEYLPEEYYYRFEPDPPQEEPPEPEEEPPPPELPEEPDDKCITAMSFRDLHREGPPGYLDFPTFTVRDRKPIRAFLDLFDLSVPRRATGLLAQRDAFVYVIDDEQKIQRWDLALDYSALIVPHGDERVLYMRRSPEVREVLDEFFVFHAARERFVKRILR